MFKKIIFRSEVKKILVQQMLRAEIKPGQRINLPTIAKQLEVSVTPVREALTQLTENRIVTYVPNRGFIMTPLKREEAINIYELIGILECSALESIEIDSDYLEKLKKAQSIFKKAKKSIDRVRHDMNFHSVLVSSFANGYAKKILEDIRIRILLYELEFMNDQNIEKSILGHDLIIDHLSKGNMSQAIKELRVNWKLGIDEILKTIQS